MAAVIKEGDRSHTQPAVAAESTPDAGVTSQASSTYTGLHNGHWADREMLMGEHGGAAHHAEPAGITRAHTPAAGAITLQTTMPAGPR